MRQFMSCLLAAVLASGMTAWWLSPPRHAGVANAQERVRTVSAEGASDVGMTPVERVRPMTSRLYDRDGLTPEESVTVGVYEAVNRGVVNITSKAARGERFLMLEVQTEGSGSGAVLDTEGNILTNYHVVQDAKEIQVTLFNGKSYDAMPVGADPLNDLAVIKVDAPEEDLYPVTLGDSRSLKVGMRVFALGNPFGLERTLTTGIISSLNRSLTIHGAWTIKSIIQIDAAINPGSSGGPLLDAHGRLIGINTAIATTTGQSAGVGFAIPVSLVSRVVPQLLEHGRVIRPEIGIVRVYQTEKGLLIAQLRPHGPAERAGLRGPKVSTARRGPFSTQRVDRNAADLIVAIDDQKISSAEDFLSYIDEKQSGDEVIVTVIRDGRKLQIPVTLSASEPPEAPRR